MRVEHEVITIEPTSAQREFVAELVLRRQRLIEQLLNGAELPVVEDVDLPELTYEQVKAAASGPLAQPK